MNEARLVCRTCGAVFAEREASQNPVEPEQEQARCPECGSMEIEPYTFAPDAPVEGPTEDEAEER